MEMRTLNTKIYCFGLEGENNVRRKWKFWEAEKNERCWVVKKNSLTWRFDTRSRRQRLVKKVYKKWRKTKSAQKAPDVEVTLFLSLSSFGFLFFCLSPLHIHPKKKHTIAQHESVRVRSLIDASVMVIWGFRDVVIKAKPSGDVTNHWWSAKH